MFGLIGKFQAQPGKRDDLLAIFAEEIGEMPGCRSYVVAADEADPDTIWITEVWDDEELHKASLELPEVQDTITRARPLIAGIEQVARTRPASGV
ncbi:putative quinol monooxygenase [Conexibacter sp. SYSU D00693]|uniref:putative quinol monooxygenase n=1 Tax=Conexibacter sp. SYSU D00693 TaxID=2812560 RepID=UPI00196ACA28|nr:putative quinol monooxygenase [Conexibacter sp. SYSU D00693]